MPPTTPQPAPTPVPPPQPMVPPMPPKPTPPPQPIVPQVAPPPPPPPPPQAMRVTPPAPDIVMPRGVVPPPPAAPTAPRSHTGAWVSGALFIGLLIGAVGGYYGEKFQTIVESILLQNDTPAAQEVAPQTQNNAADASTSADAYSDINTNPLEDVQTNPFQ